MIRRLLITSACVGFAVLAPAAIASASASASTAKATQCCDGNIVTGAPVFVPTRTVTYGNTVIPTAVTSGGGAVYGGANCYGYGGGVYGGANCCYGGVGYGYGGVYGGIRPRGYGYGYGYNRGGNTVISQGSGVGHGVGIGGLVGVGGIGVNVLSR
ncbi:hypothetical protein [Streptosporangium sp. NPDC000396]|uniref:hypothetical protein n=1 Tax=Streptosporangium sp. NPDC000396 TaxID=3366185 RepID=UPI0036C159B2